MLGSFELLSFLLKISWTLKMLVARFLFGTSLLQCFNDSMFAISCTTLCITEHAWFNVR